MIGTPDFRPYMIYRAVMLLVGAEWDSLNGDWEQMADAGANQTVDENAVHGSDAPETAAVEIEFFFPEGVCERTR